MYTASEKFTKAISGNGRRIKVKAIVNDITLLNDDIVTLSIENTLLADEEFKLGGAIASTFELVISNFDSKFNHVQFENEEIQLFIGSEVGDNRYKLKPDIEYIPMGVYKIEKANKEKYEIALSGFDRMVLLEKEYISTLVYPATLLQIANEIANKAGVKLASINFLNSGYLVKDRPLLEKVTLREAIGFIAELAGGFAIVNRFGELEIVSLIDTELKINKDNFYDFKKGDSVFGPISKVEIDSFGYKASLGYGDEVLIIKDNPFGQEPEKLISSLYSIFDNFMYTPFNSTWQGNPTMDTGDKLLIMDNHGVVCKSLVTYNKLMFSGGLKAETKAVTKNKTAKEYKNQGPISKQVTALREKVVELKTTDDSIIARVQETEREVIGAGGIRERIQAAEFLITKEAMVSTVLDSIEYNGDISLLKAQITHTASELTNNLIDTKQGLEALITVQAGQISEKVSSANFESYKLQVDNSISQKVSSTEYNGSTIASMINQTPKAIKASAIDIDLTGIVTFNSLSTPGSTVIHGANIITDTVTAARLEAYEAIIKGHNGITIQQRTAFATGYTNLKFKVTDMYDGLKDQGVISYGGGAFSLDKSMSVPYVACSGLSVGGVSVTPSSYALNGHTHGEYASSSHSHSGYASSSHYHNEFDTLSWFCTALDQKIINLESRVRALGG